jgi:hypothetical protein
MEMFLELLCWFTILFLWCFFWFFLCWSLESLSSFCSNNHTRSFLWAYISWHASYGDSMASFMNQILHLANPHDKLSIFVLYPHLGFLSIHRLSLWDPWLGHLSLSLSLVICRKEDSVWRTWALMISVFCLEWLRYGWFNICLFMVFDSMYCDIFTSMWAFSYTLPMLTWNEKLLLCSLDLLACIIIPLSCILLIVWLDLFTTLCHNFLVTIHVCSIMMFISSVDVTFSSWLVSTPVLRSVVVVVHIFLVVDGEWILLMIIDNYSCSCGFCA